MNKISSPAKFLKHRRSIRGQAAIEFAIVVPMVLVIISLVVELTSAFVEAEKVSNVSREIGKAVFYDCSGRIEPSYNSCVNTTLLDVQDRANQVLKNFTAEGQVMVSVYQWNNGNPTRMYRESFPTNTPSPALVSHFPDTPGTTIGEINLRQVDIIVVAEVYYRFMPKTPLGNLLVGFFPKYYYESAIF